MGAVIGPDFLRVGSDNPRGFRYEAGPLHATDTLYAVQAARKHFGKRIIEVS